MYIKCKLIASFILVAFQMLTWLLQHLFLNQFKEYLGDSCFYRASKQNAYDVLFVVTREFSD